MVQLSYIGIFRQDGESAQALVQDFYTPTINRFYQGRFHEMAALAHGLAIKTEPGVNDHVDEPKHNPPFRMMRYGHRDVCCIILGDLEYPNRVGRTLARILVDDFLTKHPKGTWPADPPKPPLTSPISFPELSEYLAKYQRPDEADSLTKIQKELDETKVQVAKTMDSVLERGEKISDLVNKSDALSASSKAFYTQARKQNSCCTVM